MKNSDAITKAAGTVHFHIPIDTAELRMGTATTAGCLASNGSKAAHQD